MVTDTRNQRSCNAIELPNIYFHKFLSCTVIFIDDHVQYHAGYGSLHYSLMMYPLIGNFLRDIVILVSDALSIADTGLLGWLRGLI